MLLSIDFMGYVDINRRHATGRWRWW